MSHISAEQTKRVNPDSWRPQLDGLRAIAVTLVFFHHWMNPHLGFGVLGVQLFFVLSGFLITGILLKERRAVEAGEQSVNWSVRQFYARRFLRIFPLYYFCLLLFVVLGRFGARQTFGWFFFYLSNVYFCLRGQFQGPFSHFWTLAVEEQFYLFWPWIVLLTPVKRLPSVLLALIAFAPLARLATFLLGYREYAQTSTMVWANLDTLGMGALAALILSRWEHGAQAARRWLKWAVLPCLGELILARLVSPSALWVSLDPLAVAVASVWLVCAASTGFEGFVGAILQHPVLVYLGQISYGLYVWHMFAPAFLRNILHLAHLPDSLNGGVAGFVLLFTLTVVTASLTWFAFEKPINMLKRYFPYRQRLGTKPHTLANVSVSL